MDHCKPMSDHTQAADMKDAGPGLTFYLVKLGKVRFVNSFVAEDSIYGKVLGRPESLLR